MDATMMRNPATVSFVVVLTLAGRARGAAVLVPVAGPAIVVAYGGTITSAEPGWERLFSPGDGFAGVFRYNVAGPTFYPGEHTYYEPNPGGYEYTHYLVDYLSYDDGHSPLSRLYRNGEFVSQYWWDCARVDSGSVPGLEVQSVGGTFRAVLDLSGPIDPYPADGIVGRDYGLSSFGAASFTIFAYDRSRDLDLAVVRAAVQWAYLGVAPEPSSLMLAVAGMLTAASRARRRRAAA